jgi:hypothetical protein
MERIYRQYGRLELRDLPQWCPGWHHRHHILH